MKKHLLILLVALLASPFLYSQNRCNWTEDQGLSEKDNLSSLLQCLADGESHWLLKKHFQSVLMVMGKPDAEYTDEMMELVTGALAFFKGEGRQLSTYVEQDVRPLIMAYVSPTDSAVSYYWLTLPDGWAGDDPGYPLYIELHGSGGGSNNNPLKMCFRHLGQKPAGGMAPMYRRDGYHLYPWGRGDKRYNDAAEADVWECLAHFDSMLESDPRRQYMYGFSMGGYGTWKLAHKTIDRWAAIGCYSGFGRPTREVAEIYSSIPVWMAWGALETRAKESGPVVRDMLIDAGGTVRWHEVPETGHKYLGDYQLDMLDFFRDHPK